MKVKNSLLGFDKMVIYQDDDYFLFSLDSVLLANFVTIRLNDKKILDLCTGNAPVPMLMSFKTKAKLFGVELQKYVYDLGVDSIKENGLDSQIELINEDVLNLDKIYGSNSFDIITCNPPYFKYNKNSLINEFSGKAIARHEINIKIEDIVRIASYLLKNNGTFAMVHRPERMIEILELMKKFNFEPKKIRFCYPKKNKEANILLIEGCKNGKSGLKVLNPLIIHDDDGKYTLEVHKLFSDNK